MGAQHDVMRKSSTDCTQDLRSAGLKGSEFAISMIPARCTHRKGRASPTHTSYPRFSGGRWAFQSGGSCHEEQSTVYGFVSRFPDILGSGAFSPKPSTLNPKPCLKAA